jgi:hypothetical protein
MPTKYCESCEEGKGCENYHAYIIELRRDVLDEKGDFPYEGELPEDKRVFYVGETTHSVECRYFEHTAKRPSDNHHDCTCNLLGTNPNHKSLQRYFPHQVKYVKGYEIELFPPNILGLQYQNPTVAPYSYGFPGSRIAEGDASREIERKIGCHLRSLGHAVYWGPKSKKPTVCIETD